MPKSGYSNKPLRNSGGSQGGSRKSGSGPNKYIKDAAFVEGERHSAISPRMKGHGNAPPPNAQNTAKPGGKPGVLKMWAKDNHKTGLRK